jgi:hypothetical protein
LDDQGLHIRIPYEATKKSSCEVCHREKGSGELIYAMFLPSNLTASHDYLFRIARQQSPALEEIPRPFLNQPVLKRQFFDQLHEKNPALFKLVRAEKSGARSEPKNEYFTKKAITQAGSCPETTIVSAHQERLHIPGELCLRFIYAVFLFDLLNELFQFTHGSGITRWRRGK